MACDNLEWLSHYRPEFSFADRVREEERNHKNEHIFYDDDFMSYDDYFYYEVVMGIPDTRERKAQGTSIRTTSFDVVLSF